MALNKQVFKTRTLTALVYAVVMLTALLWNTWSFFIVFSVVHFGAWYEFQKLAALIDPLYTMERWWERLLFPLFGWGLMLIASAESVELGGFHVSEAGLWIVRVLWALIFFEIVLKKKEKRFSYMKWNLLGTLYISLSLALFVNLRSGWIWGFSHDSAGLTNWLSGFSAKLMVLILVFTIWINDTMAYVVGSFIGKTPLSAWSPKKTWEGTIGGILLSVGLVYLYCASEGITGMELLSILFAIAISGTVGDLVESKLKRLAGVKDSGSFMPGHGGFLDRFDSILFAAPVVWIISYLLYR
jgi:phosphatidate cytidylyltransferase